MKWFWRWLDWLRADQLEKAIYWMERRRDLAERRGNYQRMSHFESEIEYTKDRIAMLRSGSR